MFKHLILKNNIIALGVFFAVIIGLTVHSCGPLNHLSDAGSFSAPTSLDSFSSLEDLVNLVKSENGNVVNYTSNGGENGIISMADQGACVVMYNGTLKCWGQNDKSQLGNGSITNSKTPVLATNISDKVVAVSSAYQHTCIYTYNGLKCLGGQQYGRIGDGVITDTIAASPITPSVTSGRSIKSIASGDFHSCILFADTQSVGCFGRNADGQLGNGTNTDSATLQTVAIGTTVKSIASGDFSTCAVTTDNDLYCWGKDLSNNPLKYASNVLSVSSGEENSLAHFCYISTDHNVFCFGGNTKGQLGDPSNTAFRTTPFQVSISSVNSVVAGKDHTCAITDNYTNVYCWGDNSASQLGIGSATPTTSTTPLKVTGLPNNINISDIAASDNVTCALLKNDDVYCWGNNAGPPDFLGVASPSSSNTAIKILNRKDP